jgi:hypothetical protein
MLAVPNALPQDVQRHLGTANIIIAKIFSFRVRKYFTNDGNLCFFICVVFYLAPDNYW